MANAVAYDEYGVGAQVALIRATSLPAHVALTVNARFNNSVIGNGEMGRAEGESRHGLLIDWDKRCIKVVITRPETVGQIA